MSSVARVTTITVRSETSFEDAVATGVARAAQTLRNVSGAWVKEQKVEAADGKITAWSVTLEVSFERPAQYAALPCPIRLAPPLAGEAACQEPRQEHRRGHEDEPTPQWIEDERERRSGPVIPHEDAVVRGDVPCERDRRPDGRRPAARSQQQC